MLKTVPKHFLFQDQTLDEKIEGKELVQKASSTMKIFVQQRSTMFDIFSEI